MIDITALHLISHSFSCHLYRCNMSDKLDHILAARKRELDREVKQHNAANKMSREMNELTW